MNSNKTEKINSPLMINMQNLHIFMTVISIIVLIIHIGYFFLLNSADASQLANFNFISCFVYGICIFLFSKKKLLSIAYLLFFFEILLFSTVMTWSIVDFCGFASLISSVIPLCGLLGFIYKVRSHKKNFGFYFIIIILALVFCINTIKNYLFPELGFINISTKHQTILEIYCCIIESSCMAIISIVFSSVADSHSDSQNSKIEQLTLKLFITLSQTVEAKDLYTNGHSMRVATYSEMIANAMGLSADDQRKIYFCGLLHDIGKISISNDIINKNGRLTDEEYNEIKKHSISGWNILHTIDELPELAQVARWHHERYDGKGYPDGKKEKETPLFVRIVSLADAYDAMTSNRSYRTVMERSKVISIIEEECGKQFDPEISKVFLEILKKDKDYEMREKKSFFPLS